MVRLRSAAGDDGVGAMGQGTAIRFKLPGLVAARRQAEEIVAFDVDGRSAQQFGNLRVRTRAATATNHCVASRENPWLTAEALALGVRAVWVLLLGRGRKECYPRCRARAAELVSTA